MSEHLKMQTPDITEENIAKIAALFPSAVTEMRGEDGAVKKGINFETLKQLLSHDIVDGKEHYEFTWVGKKQAMAEAARPTTQTLRPVPTDSKNWDTTQNLYIEGDNLEVLKILQQSYLGKVKMIYIDPPYNTGSDRFIYTDDFRKTYDEYSRQAGLIDENENLMIKENNVSNPHFHSDWCSMMYSRLFLARNLLRQDGAIFISIDDNECENIKKLCDEIYGEDNKVAEFVVIRAEGGGMAKQVIKGHDYLLVYCKNITNFRPLGKPKDVRGKIIEKDGERFWIQEDWLRKEFGKYGNCHYEEILQYKGQEKLDEINQGIKNGQYILIKKPTGMHVVGKLRNLKEDSSKFYSIIKHLSAKGIEDLKVLKLDKYFGYPKPVSLLEEIINGATFFTGKDGDVILDFFSGSATTAHAVMQLNAEDGGHRKFIMVQLPEPCDEKSEAYKAGYKNICEIGKERIRRAGEKIKAEHPDAEVDTGFRVFRVDSSNMKDVYFHPEQITQTMLGETVSNIKDDRTDLDLLYDCMLRCGVEIDLPHTTTVVDGCKVHNVDDGALMACFDPCVTDNVIRAMAQENPVQAIFRDSSFATDADKINVAEIFKNLSPDTKVRVI